VHAGEVATDASLVGRLIAAQFPDWADLHVERVPSAGTDNAIYRLGDDMAVRLPRIEWADGQVEREHEWLPRLAPHLPLAIPTQLTMGVPGEGYPWRWAVYRWLEGDNATHDRVADLGRAATTSLTSSQPCSGSIPRTVRANEGRAGCPWQRETARRAMRSPLCTAHWIPAL
jgi:aminoglycoside phosphotransferase (APT) family kinase protein